MRSPSTNYWGVVGTLCCALNASTSSRETQDTVFKIDACSLQVHLGTNAERTDMVGKDHAI
jgi:hypothetical protein